jgi:hypothetical protein
MGEDRSRQFGVEVRMLRLLGIQLILATVVGCGGGTINAGGMARTEVRTTTPMAGKGRPPTQR